MGSSDFVLAGLEGLFQGISSTAVPIIQNSIKLRQQNEYARQNDMRDFQNKVNFLPYQSQAQVSTKQQELAAEQPYALERIKATGQAQMDKEKSADYVPGSQILDFMPNATAPDGRPINATGTYHKSLIPLLKPGGAKTDKKEEEKLNNAKSAISIINHLQNKFETVPTGAEAVGSKAASFLTFGKSGNKSQRVYDDAFNANAAKFYRAYTNDTRLSDQDAKTRALGLLPSSMLDKQVGRGKFEEVRNNVIREVKPLLDKSGISMEDFMASVPNVGDQVVQGNFSGQTKSGLKYTITQ